jgi:hypothetical protein
VPNVGFESKPQCQEYKFVAHEKDSSLHGYTLTLAKEHFVPHDRIHDTALSDTQDPGKEKPPQI